MSAPDRPTREQAAHPGSRMVGESYKDHSARAFGMLRAAEVDLAEARAEVRALRAELERVHSALPMGPEDDDSSAPLPAVPDGEDARDLAKIRRITGVHPDAPRGELLGEVERLVQNDDFCTETHGPTAGEDVPARLDAAADALAAADLARGAAALRDAASVASIAGPDVRAAVAAALARPTGGQE